MPQQITVGAGGKKPLVTLAAALAQGQRNRRVRMMRADGRDEFGKAIVVEPGVFAALEDERAEAEVVADLAAAEDFV